MIVVREAARASNSLTMRRFMKLPFLLLLTVCLVFSSPLQGTELKATTAAAFQHYVDVTEARMQTELADPQHFLYFDSLPEAQKQAMVERLRSGQVVVQTLRTTEKGKPIEVPDGLVHHWMAIAFLPGVTRDQVVALEEDYPRHPQIYGPDVQQAKVISQTGQHYTVYFRFYRQAIVTVVYNVDFNVEYVLPDASRAYSISHGTRIAEVQDVGKADEKELPIGNDHGYMWRLNLYARYLERDGGVYVQIEFLALSRRVPAVFAWLVNPYVRAIPRDYLTHFMIATRKALPATTGVAAN